MLWTLQLSLPMEMVSKFHPNVFWLNVRRDGPQPSICVRTLSPITTNPACARTTFAEPLADLVVPHARRTNRQASRLRAIAKELGGRPAARESENVLMPVEPPHAAAFTTPCSHSRFSSPTRAWGRRLVAPQGANLRDAPRRLATTPHCRALA